MLCARLLKPVDHAAVPAWPLRVFERGFSALTRGYGFAVRKAVGMPRIMLALTVMTFVATAFIFQSIPKGFFPQEDTGLLTGATVGPDDASFEAMVARQGQLAAIVARDPDVVSVMSTVGGGNAASTQNSGRLFVTLRDRPERKAGAEQVIARLRRETAGVPGIQAFFQPVQNISVGGQQTRSQYQYVLQSVDLDALQNFAPKLEAALRRVPGIQDVNSDLALRARSTVVSIDRDAAARLGVSVDQIRSTLYSAFGSRQVSTIYAPETPIRSSSRRIRPISMPIPCCADSPSGQEREPASRSTWWRARRRSRRRSPSRISPSCLP